MDYHVKSQPGSVVDARLQLHPEPELELVCRVTSRWTIGLGKRNVWVFGLLESDPVDRQRFQRVACRGICRSRISGDSSWRVGVNLLWRERRIKPWKRKRKKNSDPKVPHDHDSTRRLIIRHPTTLIRTLEKTSGIGPRKRKSTRIVHRGVRRLHHTFIPNLGQLGRRVPRTSPARVEQG